MRHPNEECAFCRISTDTVAERTHKKVPPGAQPQVLVKLLLLHHPTMFKSCAECHSTWPCDTNKTIHAYLQENK